MRDYLRSAKSWAETLLAMIIPAATPFSLLIPIIQGFMPGEQVYGNLYVYGIGLVEFHRAAVILPLAPLFFFIMPLCKLSVAERRRAVCVITLLALCGFAVSVYAAWNWMVASVEQVHPIIGMASYPLLLLCSAVVSYLPNAEGAYRIGGDTSEP